MVKSAGKTVMVQWSSGQGAGLPNQRFHTLQPSDNRTLFIKWSTETNKPYKGDIFFCKIYLKYI